MTHSYTPQFYKDTATQWRWRVWAENARIIGAASEGFSTQQGAAANASLLGEMLERGGAPLEVYQDHSGDWRWRVWAENARIVGAASEGYRNRGDCEANVRQLRDSLSKWRSMGAPL